MMRSTFAIPAVVALVSLIGLVGALTGDGLRDMLSWAALGLPVAAVAWAMRRPRRPTSATATKSARAPNSAPARIHWGTTS